MLKHLEAFSKPVKSPSIIIFIPGVVMTEHAIHLDVLGMATTSRHRAEIISIVDALSGID